MGWIIVQRTAAKSNLSDCKVRSTKEKLKRHLLIDYLAMAGLAVLTALDDQIFIRYKAVTPSRINGLVTMAQYLFHISIGYLLLMINLLLALFVFLKVDR
ncbi:MAG: YitT family protein [Clostridia bacterium]